MSWDEFKGKIEEFCESKCTELKKKYDDLCRQVTKTVYVSYSLPELIDGRLCNMKYVFGVVLDCEDRAIKILPPQVYQPDSNLFIVGHLYIHGDVIKYAAHTNAGEKIAHLFKEESASVPLDTYVQRIVKKFAAEEQ